MGRLRELLDDLARKRDEAPPTDDEQARDGWRNEGGQGAELERTPTTVAARPVRRVEAPPPRIVRERNRRPGRA